MTWHVQYRRGEEDCILHRLTPELAIEAACRLIDEGLNVTGIGTSELAQSIGPAEIAKIYALWDLAAPTRLAARPIH